MSATYLTCTKCLSVETKTETIEQRDDGQPERATCENCGHSAVSLSAHTFGYDGFDYLDGSEIVERRERVEAVSGETPWS